MRTKALLLAAALTAAGIASIHAQSNVYSVNVVGYVNVAIPNGYSLIANPLNSTDNTVSNLFSGSPSAVGNTVYTWNGANFVANFYDDLGGEWANPSLVLAPGTGFFVNNPGAAYTNTFVGEVPQGNLVNAVPAGYTLTASQVPQTGFTQDLGLNAVPGDYVYLWNGNNFVAVFYDDLGGEWNPAAGFTVDPAKGPQVGVAQSFFYRNISGTGTFVRSFTVQ
jgi:hypothetical protein